MASHSRPHAILPRDPEPRALHIMTFLHSFEPGGVERVALRLCGAWAGLGARVSIAMGRTSGPQAGDCPSNVELLVARRSRLAAPFESLWLVPHLVAMVRKHRPDVLFCAGNTYSIVAVLARLWLGADCSPMLLKVSNSVARTDLPAPARWAYRLWLRWQAATFHRLVGMAEPMRGEIAAGFAVAPGKISIVFDPALDEALINRLQRVASERRRDTGRIRYVAVGRLVAQKNFGLAIRAFARVAGAQDRLTILGDGPERAKLEALSARLGVTDRVVFAGHVDGVGNHFADADIFLLSSDYEGVPAVVIEALAAGLPIVATDCSVSMASLLGGGAFGWLVGVRDEAAFADAMLDAATVTWPVEAMRQSARRFTVERSAADYLHLFEAAATSAEAQAAAV